jgi:hypothetical protein
MMTELKLKGVMPIMKNLRVNKEIDSFFFDRFISCVIGKDKYKKHCLVAVPSVYTNEGDEAMTLWILAHNDEVWSEISTLNQEQGRQMKKHWVGDLLRKQQLRVEVQGWGRSWSKEGRQYYNLMFELIRADCTIRGESFDQSFLSKLQQEDEQCQSLCHERQCSKARLATERIECRNNYGGDGDEEINGALVQMLEVVQVTLHQ